MAGIPTLAEVAAAAGVSPATASRALSGSVRVTTSTRRRVNDAVVRLGYVRRRAVYTLDRPPTKQAIAVAVCEPLPRALFNPFHVRLLTAVEQVLAAHGASLVVVPSTEATAVRPLVSGAFGGVLLVGAVDQRSVAVTLAAANVTVCGVGRPPDGVCLPYVDVDNVDGGRQAAEHLLARGRRRIGVIAGPAGYRPTRTGSPGSYRR